jgi:hypothetical protein
MLVLVTLAAFVLSEEHDQETAEQFFQIHGYYPTWYHHAPAVYRGYPYYYNYPAYHALPLYQPYLYGFRYVL